MATSFRHTTTLPVAHTREVLFGSRSRPRPLELNLASLELDTSPFAADVVVPCPRVSGSAHRACFAAVVLFLKGRLTNAKRMGITRVYICRSAKKAFACADVMRLLPSKYSGVEFEEGIEFPAKADNTLYLFLSGVHLCQAANVSTFRQAQALLLAGASNSYILLQCMEQELAHQAGIPVGKNMLHFAGSPLVSAFWSLASSDRDFPAAAGETRADLGCATARQIVNGLRRGAARRNGDESHHDAFVRAFRNLRSEWTGMRRYDRSAVAYVADVQRVHGTQLKQRSHLKYEPGAASLYDTIGANQFIFQTQNLLPTEATYGVFFVSLQFVNVHVEDFVLELDAIGGVLVSPYCFPQNNHAVHFLLYCLTRDSCESVQACLVRRGVCEYQWARLHGNRSCPWVSCVETSRSLQERFTACAVKPSVDSSLEDAVPECASCDFVHVDEGGGWCVPAYADENFQVCMRLHVRTAEALAAARRVLRKLGLSSHESATSGEGGLHVLVRGTESVRLLMEGMFAGGIRFSVHEVSGVKQPPHTHKRGRGVLERLCLRLGHHDAGYGGIGAVVKVMKHLDSVKRQKFLTLGASGEKQRVGAQHVHALSYLTRYDSESGVGFILDMFLSHLWEALKAPVVAGVDVAFRSALTPECLTFCILWYCCVPGGAARVYYLANEQQLPVSLLMPPVSSAYERELQHIASWDERGADYMSPVARELRSRVALFLGEHMQTLVSGSDMFRAEDAADGEIGEFSEQGAFASTFWRDAGATCLDFFPPFFNDTPINRMCVVCICKQIARHVVRRKERTMSLLPEPKEGGGMLSSCVLGFSHVPDVLFAQWVTAWNHMPVIRSGVPVVER